MQQRLRAIGQSPFRRCGTAVTFRLESPKDRGRQSFSFTLPTATYDLAFVNSGGFSPYRYFGYDVGAQQFVSADIAGYPQILSAIKDDYASGFFVRADGPILFRDYGPGGSEVAFTNVTISTGVVPEPSAWGLMILGFGAVGSAMRRRATARAVAA